MNPLLQYEFGKSRFRGILDLYPSSTIAYSFQKLRKGYLGYCCAIVIPSATGVNHDIAFNNNVVDTAAILAYAAGGDAYLSIFYDQSGTGNNLTQTTFAAMPKIVDAGVLVTNGGKPAILFDGINDYLYTVSTITLPQPFTFLRVFMGYNTGTSNLFVSALGILLASTSTGNNRISAGNLFSSSGNVATDQINLATFNETSSISLINRTLGPVGNVGVNTLNSIIEVGKNYSSSSNYRNHYLQELILWSSNQIINFTSISGNRNAYYTKY